MELIKVIRQDDTDESIVTLRMTHEEAHAFALALQEGKLAHLGIAGAHFGKPSQQTNGTKKWGKREQSHRDEPDKPKSRRR